MHRTIVGFASLLLLTTGAVGSMQASCGSATCPLNNQKSLRAGWIHVMLTRESINQDRIYVGSSPSFVGALPNDHDEVQTVNRRTALSLQYGISDGIALTAELPFVHRTHTHIDEGRIESFDVSGLGDLIVGGQFSLLSTPEEESGPSLSVQISAKLPTGVTDATGTDGEIAEVTIQPGTGSLDGIAGVTYRQSLLRAPTLSGEIGVVPLTAGVSYQVSGKGTNGYRMGSMLLLNLGLEYRLLDHLTLLLQANGMFRDFADAGSTGESAQNTGGTWIFISPGLRLPLGDHFAAFGYVQLPVYLNVHGIQQTSGYNMLFGVTADVGMFE